jgi:hypothetical protein
MQNQYEPLESESERAWRMRSFHARIDQMPFQHQESSHGTEQRADEFFQDPLANHIKCPDCHSLEHLVGDTVLAVAAVLQRKRSSIYGLAMLVKDATVTLNAIDQSSEKLDDLSQQVEDSLDELKLNCGDCDAARRAMSPRVPTVQSRIEPPSSSLRRAEWVKSAVKALSEEAFDASSQTRGPLELWLEHTDRAAELEAAALNVLYMKQKTLDTAISARKARFEPDGTKNQNHQQQQQHEAGNPNGTNHQQHEPSVPNGANDQADQQQRRHSDPSHDKHHASRSPSPATSGNPQASPTEEALDGSKHDEADGDEAPDPKRPPNNWKPSRRAE